MRHVLLLVAALILMPGCFLAWAYVDASNDKAKASNDMPRCEAWCKAQGGSSFERWQDRTCGCQLDAERFAWSPWPQP